MLAIAVLLLALLAFLQAVGNVSQTVAVILSAAAGILAILSLIGYGPTVLPVHRRQVPPGA